MTGEEIIVRQLGHVRAIRSACGSEFDIGNFSFIYEVGASRETISREVDCHM